MGDLEERNEQLVRTFFETLSTGDLERVRPMLHEDATWTVMASGIPGAGEKKGRNVIIDEFLAAVRGIFEDGDPKVSVVNVISKGRLVAAETRGVGRLKSGTPYNNVYSWMIEVDDGKIRALREYMDSYYVSTIM
ncbi:MAG TPA: nuclear transport factor 2 family protein [Xanthobacteraceae bacterium]